MWFKRLFSVLVAVLFSLAVWQSASAQSAELPLANTPVVTSTEAVALPPLPAPTIATTFTVAPGGTITVPVIVTEVAGRGYISIQGNVSVDPNVVELVGVHMRNGHTVAWADITYVNNLLPGAGLYFGAMNYQEWTGKGSLFDVIVQGRGKAGECSSIIVGSLLLNEKKFPLIIGKVCIVLPTVSGSAYYQGIMSRPVPNVLYNLQGPGEEVYTANSPTGKFSWSVITPETYQLFSAKTGDQRGAITAFDAALTMRCAMLLANNCDLAVADVSQSGDLTPYDAGSILRYTVGIEDMSGQTVTGTWFRTDANRWPVFITQDKVMDVYYSLRGDVSGNWGASSVVAASAAEVQVSAEDGQLVIRSTDHFISAEVTVEDNSILLGVEDWTFVKNENRLFGYANSNSATELRIPMDGHVMSVRLDERELVVVDIWIDSPLRGWGQTFLPLIGQ